MFIDLSTVVLEANSPYGEWLAGGTIAAFVAIAVSIFFSYKEQKASNQTQMMDMFQSYSKQLTDLIQRESDLKTQAECEAYAMNYLDTVDQIAYLYNKEFISDKISWYFENHFRYGLTIHDWLINHHITEAAATEKDLWADLLKISHILREESLDKLPEDQLPYAMQEYDSLKRDVRSVDAKFGEK